MHAASANLEEGAEAALQALVPRRRPWLTFTIIVFLLVFVFGGAGPLINLVQSKPGLATTRPQTAAVSPRQMSLPPPPPPPPHRERSRAAIPAFVPPPAPRAASSPAGVADPTCHAKPHADYMGERAPVWGYTRPPPRPRRYARLPPTRLCPCPQALPPLASRYPQLVLRLY